MITYTIEKLNDNIEELKEISKLHFAESAPYQDIALNVNWERFLLLEDAGVLQFYVMRKKSFLIGYAVFFVSASMEYKNSVQASMSNIFIHPDHRGNGGNFIKWCDEQLKDLGVQVVYHHVKSRNDYGSLLKRLGYETMNVEYAKRLDKDE